MLLTLTAALALVSVQSRTELALRGLDPVLLCKGIEREGHQALAERYGPFEYHFADEASRERFLAAPDRWAIQWSGGCGRMGPLSGRGSSERWAVHDGRLYLFASDGCRDGFLAEPERFVVAPPAPPDVSPADLSRGKAWLARTLAAHGGAALDARHALRLVRESDARGWTHREELLLSATGELARRSVWTPPADDASAETYDMTRVLAERAFERDGEAVVDIEGPAARDDLTRLGQRELLPLFWARNAPGFVVAYLGAGTLDSQPTTKLLVHHAGLSTKLHVDPESARVRGISWRGRLGDGATHEVLERFTAWRDLDGVLLPSAREVRLDGEPDSDAAVTWTTMELLEAAPAGAFDRPQPR